MRAFYDYDIFINMNITKEHSGNNMSGALKNLMGINSPVSDQTFHRREGLFGDENIAHLDQCIADLNTIIRPHLCISDATVFVTTNGPNGPGKLRKSHKVVAGVNPVAMDAYCCRFLGLKGKDIKMIQFAHKHGIGEYDLGKLKVLEIQE